MRTLLIALVTLVLAYGVWKILGDDESLPDLVSEDATPASVPSEPAPYVGGVTPTTTTLSIVVTSLSGHVPEGARAGYVYGGREQLRKVDARGAVTFTDAPLGMVEIVARAPGFERGVQRRYLNAGVPSEVRMALKLQEGFTPAEPPAKDR